MTPTHAVKKGTRYRYYVSRRLMVGTANKSVCDGQRIPGANLEDLIIGRVRTFVANPLALLKAVSKGRFGAPLQKKLKEAAEDLLRSWDNEPSADAVSAFLRTILIRVRIHADRIEVEVDANRVAEFLLPTSTKMFGRYRPPPSPAPTPTRRMTNTRSSHSSYQLSSSAREKSLSSSSRALRNAHHPTRASSGSYFGLMLSASVCMRASARPSKHRGEGKHGPL